MSNSSSTQSNKPPPTVVPAAALKRFADDLGTDSEARKFYQLNKDRVQSFIEKPIRPAHIVSQNTEKGNLVIPGINNYDEDHKNVNTFLHLQTLPEFQTSLGPRSRFGEGDGSFFDRWLNSDIATSKNLYDKDGFPLMKFSLKEVNSGYKKHLDDYKEQKDTNGRAYYMKPYAERRAERLAKEKAETEATIKQQQHKEEGSPNRARKLVFDDKVHIIRNNQRTTEKTPSPQKSNPSLSFATATMMSPMAQQLSPAERENYFGDNARAAFFEYYHHLSRQHGSMEVKQPKPSAHVTSSTAATTITTLEGSFPVLPTSSPPHSATASQNNSRPVSKGITFAMQETKSMDHGSISTNPSRPISPEKLPMARIQPKLPDYNAPPQFAMKRNDHNNPTDASNEMKSSDKKCSHLIDSKENQARKKSTKNKDYEKQMLLEHLLAFTKKGWYNEPNSNNNNDNNNNSQRPHSARTIFLRGCVELGFLPQSSLIIRKDFTTVLNINSLGIGNDIAKLLADALDALPALEGLSIVDNNLTDAGLVPIVNKLANCKSLTLFDLSNNKVDSLTAEALRKFLTSPGCRLTKLYMRNANVDDIEATQFVESIASQHTVTELDLSQNLLGSQELSVSYRTNITSGEAIGNLLKSPQCALESLSLAWNMIRFKSANAIVHSLQYNATLLFLDLSYNGLGVEGGEILGNALHYNKVLQVLKIAHNNITARATVVIFSGIKACESLREVDLSANPIGEEGAKALLPLNIFYGFRVSIDIKNCSIRLKDSTCWFDNTVTYKKEYELDLSKPYDRAVGHEILRIVAKDPDLTLAKCVWVNPEDGSEKSFHLASYTDRRQVLPTTLGRSAKIVNPESADELAQLVYEGEKNVRRTRSSFFGAVERKKSSMNGLTLSNSFSREEIDKIIETTESNEVASNTKPFETAIARPRQPGQSQKRGGVTRLSAVGADEQEIRNLFRQTANRIFHQYDTDYSGDLDREELAYLLEQLGLSGAWNLVDKVLSIYDTDGYGKVEEEEFICFLIDIRKGMEKNGNNLNGIPENIVYYMYDQEGRMSLKDTSSKPPLFQFPEEGTFYLKVANVNLTNHNTPRASSATNSSRGSSSNHSSRSRPRTQNSTKSNNANISNEQLLENMSATNVMVSYLKAGKSISDASSLFDFALQSNKWTINQARTFFKLMIKEYGSSHQVLMKVLPHMASYLDARMLITDVTNHDFQITQQIKSLLGPLYRIYVGLPNGYYQLWLHEPNDRLAFIRLIELSQHQRIIRQQLQLGDVSQLGNWQGFRNLIHDHIADGIINESWFENPEEEVPDKGKIEFDFISMERITSKDGTPISNLRLFRLLLSLGIVDGNKRRRIFNRLEHNEADGRLASKGYGVRGWEMQSNANKLYHLHMEEKLYGAYRSGERKVRTTSIPFTAEDNNKHNNKRNNAAALSRQRSAKNSNNLLNGGGVEGEQEGVDESLASPPRLLRGNSTRTGSERSDLTATTTGTGGGDGGEVEGGGGGFVSTEVYSMDMYGHHIKEMIGEDIMRPKTDIQQIAIRVLDAFETILAGRYLTCSQLALIVEKFPGGNIVLSAYATYRVELIIALFSYLIDVINFDLIIKELEPSEIAMCYFRLGWLCIWNPIKPEGYLTLNLSRYEERQIVKMLITLNYEETGETWQNVTFQESFGSEPIVDWKLPANWYEETGLPNQGILSLLYYSGKGKQMQNCAPNVNCRLSLMPLVLSQPYEEDMRHHIEHNMESAENILLKAGIRLSFSATHASLPTVSSASMDSSDSSVSSPTKKAEPEIVLDKEGDHDDGINFD